MFFGLTIEKIAVIAVIAALVVGPERLPRYAEALARFTGRAREFLRGARERMRDEMGPDFDEVDWRKLDPRQYDPRRIIREALLDDAPVPPARMAPASAPVAASAADSTPATSSSAPSPRAIFATGDSPPFDTEAT